MKTLKIFSLLVLNFLVGMTLAHAASFNALAGGTIAVGLQYAYSFIPKQIGVTSAATGFELTDINAALGAYCRKHEKKILSTIFKGIQFENFMSPVGGISDEYTQRSSTINEVLQPYQATWTPKGTVSFDARINKVRQVKIDYEIAEIDQIYTSFLCDMADETKQRNIWEFVKYIVSQEVIPKVAEEMDFNSYNGVYAAPTPGTPGDSIDSVDGIDKIVVDAIAGADIVPIVTGALTPANIVDAVETFVDSLPNPHKNYATPIFMSETNARNYQRNYRDNFGLNSNYTGKVNLAVDYSNKSIVGIDAMEGSDRFIHTSPKNMIKMFDKINLPTKLESQLDKRIINLLADFKRGYGFRRFDTLFVNEQT